LETHDQQDISRIQVHVDADLQEIVPGFLANRNKDLEVIRDALAAGDYERIRVAGHSMKGSGGGYGFDAITEFGSALEWGGKNKDDKTIREAAGSLRNYLDRVEVSYE
jgi:HPt (histidine-containing phosphotransfer) domain-containing protein